MKTRTKPDGGFRFIGSHQLLNVYNAYRAGFIQWYDVRVWFAAQEAVARRCCAPNGVPPHYTVDEIAILVCAGALKPVRASLKRLNDAKLMHWTESAVSFSKSRTMVKDLGTANRQVPVPRRTIRLIARSARKVLAATMLGHVLRCCYFRDGAYRFEGSCSAAWVAHAFGLDERNVKIARKHLVAIGWLTPMRADAWHRQRFGGRWAVNPEWASRERPQEAQIPNANTQHLTRAKRSPRMAALVSERSPLLILKENSFGSKNQKPAVAADPPPGVCQPKSEIRKPPTLKNVVMEDLRETARTIRLFDEAAKEGLVHRSEADRLKVVAAAERALRVGTSNPCGLFARLLHGQLWHHINHEEEERARRKLQLHFIGRKPPELALVVPHASRLSMDAMVVAAVKRTVVRHRLDVDAFEALRRERPDWTQERWLRAQSELAGRPIAPLGHSSVIAA